MCVLNISLHNPYHKSQVLPLVASSTATTCRRWLNRHYLTSWRRSETERRKLGPQATSFLDDWVTGKFAEKLSFVEAPKTKTPHIQQKHKIRRWFW